MIDLTEIQQKILEVLKDEKYGLTAEEIKQRANLRISTQIVGLICAWTNEVVCVAERRGGKRWRLIKVNGGDKDGRKEQKGDA